MAMGGGARKTARDPTGDHGIPQDRQRHGVPSGWGRVSRELEGSPCGLQETERKDQGFGAWIRNREAVLLDPEARARGFVQERWARMEWFLHPLSGFRRSHAALRG